MSIQTNSLTSCNLNNIFTNCSLLSYIPNISKWKLNKNIKAKDIFKGCNSLLTIPDLSKWNICSPEELINISSFNSNEIYIKEIKSNSLISEDNIKYINLNENSSSLEKINDIVSPKKSNFEDASKNSELDDYYDNFYS